MNKEIAVVHAGIFNKCNFKHKQDVREAYA